MSNHPVIRFLARIILCFIGCAGALWVITWCFIPDLSSDRQPKYTDEEIRAAKEAADVSFDPNDIASLPDLHVDVDYSEGPEAAWYPKGESPILAELVAEGKLPPVAERVGPEPIVMTGSDPEKPIGKYGGTWLRIATTPGDVSVITWRMSYASWARWSPLGYPLQMHLAKFIEANEDKTEFIVTLRKGIRWSDGHPYTADDVMYVWNHEMNDPAIGRIPDWLKTSGIPGKIAQLTREDGSPDPYRVKFSFEKPYGLFMEAMAGSSYYFGDRPAHYLKRYHPTLGDKEKSERMMAALKLPSRNALYSKLRHFTNPDCPRLWPWIYRTYKSTPPQVFVRNPYYYVVDAAGNQLPYIDRIQFDVQSGNLIAVSAADGKISMQTRHMRYEHFTELMRRRDQSNIDVLQWYPASRSVWAINPNLNRRIDPNDSRTAKKSELLANRRFRQALSIAINREAIIRAEYNGQVEPSQVAPGPESPFHDEQYAKSWTEYAPERASTMLDEIGLTKRDLEGYRTFPDGRQMTFFIDVCAFTGVGPAQFIVDDWAKVGIRLIIREQNRSLFYIRKNAMDFDFNVWSGESDYLPLVLPRYFVPHHTESFYAVGWGRWFRRGGYFDYDNPELMKGALRPPKDHPIYHAMTHYVRALEKPTLAEQVEEFRKVLAIAEANTWTINISTPPPQLVVKSRDMRNVPKNALYGAIFKTPGNTGIETYYFEHPNDSAGAILETKKSLLKIRPLPGLESESSSADTAAKTAGTGGPKSVPILRHLIFAILVCFVLMMGCRHPYIGRRLLSMIPTLFIISIVIFAIIQLPPGDFLSAKIMQLQESGDVQQERRIDDLRRLFHFDEASLTKYLRWMGFRWFMTFNEKDMGLLQGHMGRSMETTQEVNKMVGDRITLTFLISLGTILFTWAIAIPVGVYSAVKQYSIGDYVLTFLGFIGMCVPNFLLALVLMAATGSELGLFSAEYAAQPEWTWGKVVDLLKHIWIPVIVLGIGGTAGMIRVMRANLLDELKKPYVTTARAKGVRPVKLLFKYPVRLALNPFISGIGGLFPQLVSGGAIVAMVLSLPTVGPMMLDALFSQDMYLAGSMLMVLSLLGVFGTLVSDLLLLWLDPRIRYEEDGK